MSKTIPIALQNHKNRTATTLAQLLRIGPAADGTIIGLTTLDRDIVYNDGAGAVTYRAHTGMDPSAQMASADLSVDNAEVTTLQAVGVIPGITEDMVERGLFDKAPFALYEVNYLDLTQGHEIIATGTIGEQTIKAGGAVLLELRSISQQAKQSVVELDSLTCRVKRFGSQVGEERFPCLYDITGEWVNFTIAAAGVEPTREFRALGVAESDGYFAPGLVEMLTGDNAGAQVEIEAYSAPPTTYASVLHFDGADGSTTIADESGATWTAYGNAQLDTGSFVFGGSSLQLDGSGDYIETADSASWAFGTGQFTVELRARMLKQSNFMVGQWGSTVAEQNWMLWINGGQLEFRFRDTGGTIRSVSTTLFPVSSTWYHIAATRDGSGVVRLFLDGALVASATLAQAMQDTTGTLRVGANSVIGAGYDYQGWIDELAISKGVAVYTAAFTPPTAAPANNIGGLVTCMFTLPYPFAPGDTGRLRRECSRAWEGHNSCETYHGTLRGLRFRGEPFIPVGDPVMAPGAEQ